MAAPTMTHRGQPADPRLLDGFRTVVAFAAAPTVSFWEMQVQPIGLDGGDPIQTTTMFNREFHTMGPRQLKKATPMSLTVAYNPKLFNATGASVIRSLINNPTSVTVHFPNGDAVTFWGFLQKFEPGELKEGEMPTAKVTVVPTLTDPATGGEEPPVWQSGAGTGT